MLSKKLFITLLSSSLLAPINLYAQDYWLVIGSYRQGPGAKPAVSGITSPSLYAIPMQSLELCKKAGEKISKEIYKPVWNFDNRWTCIKSQS
tara:strand:+ start:367 stop:642 length:276 start_codon:yes stop_codon:yes gene_type:complete